MEADVSIHCRFTEKPEFPSILYFHGNGEIVSDYDGFAHLFNAAGANLVVADYRGYGDSTGTPAFATMIEDAHRICAAVKKNWPAASSALTYIMGRSLGSVSALELAAADNGECKGLIIESGFV